MQSLHEQLTGITESFALVLPELILAGGLSIQPSPRNCATVTKSRRGAGHKGGLEPIARLAAVLDP